VCYCLGCVVDGVPSKNAIAKSRGDWSCASRSGPEVRPCGTRGKNCTRAICIQWQARNYQPKIGEDNAKKIIVFFVFVYSKLYIFLFTLTTVSRRPTNYYETSGHSYKSCFANFETISKFFLSKFNSFIVLYSFYLFLYASASFFFF
jgi:hypothetical protein